MEINRAALSGETGRLAARMVPPVAKVYVATINAGAVSGIGQSLLLWAIPGALIQLIGGPKRQLGVLLATGLLIASPMAGWAVAIGIALRLVIEKVGGEKARGYMEVFAGGVIAGDALFSFLPHGLLPWKFASEAVLIIGLVLLNLRGVKESIAWLTP